MKYFIIVILLLVLVIIFCNCFNNVIVIDGDTIKIANGTFIRYIGIDCPEYGEPLYFEAKKVNAKLISSGKLRFEADINDQDVHGRLLRYVFVNGNFINYELVRLGYALVYKPGMFPETRYTALLILAANEAYKNRRGLWNLIDKHPKFEKNYYYIPEK